ncbi:MAG: AAA family ATPase [Bacteroidaceae bacterium]|nr:AAA family ATPase [Bacteroidaceae bacterium]
MPINSQMRAFILEKFGFQPTKEQEIAVEMLSDFLFERNEESIFVLKGYAGTGKTSLVGALVRSLVALNQRVVLMAPTGRAAKVFAQHAGHAAYTIHRRIYRQKVFAGEESEFLQGVNMLRNTLFIVDEASMVSNEGGGGMAFGTGRLLDDLIHFVYNSQGCRLVMVGDTAQLPPVGEEESPALCSNMLAGYGLQVHEMTLTTVVRQLADSGILWNATQLRQLLAEELLGAFPQLRLKDFADIIRLPGNELIEALELAYHDCGTDGTIVVTRSNARAVIYNRGIRARVLDHEEELGGGDQIIVVKNNYHWIQPDEPKDKKNEDEDNQNNVDFIANGDAAVVRRIRSEREVHGFRFADVVLEFPDYDNMEVTATALLDTLQSEAPALTRQQQQELFQKVWDDYPEKRNKRDRMKAVKEDPYYNALQIKYGYAVTCHKAQGGQWQRVFIDQGYVTEDMLSADYFRWLYTALTRATERVYLVNWPLEELDEASRMEMEY